MRKQTNISIATEEIRTELLKGLSDMFYENKHPVLPVKTTINSPLITHKPQGFIFFDTETSSKPYDMLQAIVLETEDYSVAVKPCFEYKTPMTKGLYKAHEKIKTVLEK